MNGIAEGILMDGTRIQYVINDNPPRGGMKYTYFAPDKSYVVQFFNDPHNSRNRDIHRRIEAIIGKYNPTLPESAGGARGNSKSIAEYFSERFCWPTAIVQYPEFGIVCPAYPSNYFFNECSSSFIDLKGVDKKSNWFTSKNRKYLEPEELGDFRMMLQLSISLARSIRRMHQAGLAHSDLSNNNVLIDPKTGRCVVIDIDSLVVPGLFPPEVVGTRGYIAPEILSTMKYPFGDSRRKLPSIYTDLHSLPVLLYEYLLFRHPLIGPKIYSKASAEEDDFLALGPMATFVENPNDTSNRPAELNVKISDLGPILKSLFLRAFVDGLHDPNERPTAMEWEKGLVKTWELLHPCENPICAAKWFILYDDNNPVCPFCGHRINKKNLIRLKFKSELRGRNGHWVNAGETVVYDNMQLFPWHIYSNCFPDEKADKSQKAYIRKYQGQWLLINTSIKRMISPGGRLVPAGQAVLLKNGTVFRISDESNGMLVEVVAAD